MKKSIKKTASIKKQITEEWVGFASLFSRKEWAFLCSDEKFLNCFYENLEKAAEISTKLLNKK